MKIIFTFRWLASDTGTTDCTVAEKQKLFHYTNCSLSAGKKVKI